MLWKPSVQNIGSIKVESVDLVIELALFVGAAVVVWLLAVFSVFVHELGHALVALLVTDETATIEMGMGSASWTTQIGRLRIVLYGEKGLCGIAEWVGRGWRTAAAPHAQPRQPTLSRYLAIVLAGPFASFLLASGFTCATWLIGSHFTGYGWALPTFILAFIALWNWLLACGNILPRKVTWPSPQPGIRRTDGRLALHYVRLFWTQWRSRPDPFTGYSDAAHAALTYAIKSAIRLNHTHIGVEHCLLGLTQEQAIVAKMIMAALGVEDQSLHNALEMLLVPREEPLVQDPKITVGMSQALGFAWEEAAALGHSYVGTGDLLLGLLRQADSGAAGVLLRLGITLDEARVQAQRILTEMPSPRHDGIGIHEKVQVETPFKNPATDGAPLP